MTDAPIPIVETIGTMKNLSRRWRSEGEVIGLVPTMGALHEGHLSLVRAAKAECTRVVVSIFVNPLQFGKNEDFTRYPRDLEKDARLLATVGCDAIFAARADAMYPPGFATIVRNDALSQRFEGAIRPGHFDGVLTVVLKLFNLVAPDVAYFGQKDIQQALLIRGMRRDLNLPLRIEVCPIVREPDGLAMSSRNVYLSREGRVAARALSRGLRAAEAAFVSGEREPSKLVALARGELEKEPLVTPDYVALTNARDLSEIASCDGLHALVLLVAARVENTRLLDNLLLFPDAKSTPHPDPSP